MLCSGQIWAALPERSRSFDLEAEEYAVMHSCMPMTYSSHGKALLMKACFGTLCKGQLSFSSTDHGGSSEQSVRLVREEDTVDFPILGVETLATDD